MSPNWGNNSIAGTDASPSSSFSVDAGGASGASGGGGGGGENYGRQHQQPHRPVDSDFDLYTHGRPGNNDDGGTAGDPAQTTTTTHAKAKTNAKKKKKGGGAAVAPASAQDKRDKYDRDTRCMAKSLSTVAVLFAAGFLTWKYGLDEPQSWEETREGFRDVWEAAGDQWKEWDLGNFTDVLGGLDGVSFEDLFGGDPMLGDNTTLRWDNDYVDAENGGLRLTLQNALDDTWQTEFELAVADWRESDALQLTTERVAVDYNCSMVEGVMVVCNANFGATGWVGINENSILRGVIVSSVAKMNEYYLRNADFDHRRFTMCHEIGHGEYGYSSGVQFVFHPFGTRLVFPIIALSVFVGRHCRRKMIRPSLERSMPTLTRRFPTDHPPLLLSPRIRSTPHGRKSLQRELGELFR